MQITTITQEKYPYLLRQIKQLPKSMDMAGTLPGDDNKFLCVIGSRRHSAYGEEVCGKLIAGLKGYPIVIVSGLAIGIDSMAHQAALDNGLKTIAFPGSGLSRSVLYPPSRRYLAERIVASGGVLLSPFSLRQEGADWTFPTRNRLMAGVSQAILLVEAGKGSGTLLTANNAIEFGRDVLVAPGNIFSELSYGPHMLIRSGATPITSSADILEALGFKIARADGTQQVLPNFAEMQLTPEEKTVVDHIRRERLSSSELIERTAMSPTKLNTVISELEIRGIIAVCDGLYRIA